MRLARGDGTGGKVPLWNITYLSLIDRIFFLSPSMEINSLMRTCTCTVVSWLCLVESPDIFIILLANFVTPVLGFCPWQTRVRTPTVRIYHSWRVQIYTNNSSQAPNSLVICNFLVPPILISNPCSSFARSSPAGLMDVMLSLARSLKAWTLSERLVSFIFSHPSM